MLKKARSLGIETFDISPVKLKATHDYVSELNTVLTGHSIDYILLAGYMKKIPAAIVQEYRNRIVNIHPALLPSFGGKGFYGMRVHDAVIERGVKWSGVTVHFVDEIYDHGPIIFQYPVRVYDDDTAETLAGRVLDIEHKAYPKVVRWLCQGWITVKGNKTIFTGPEEEWGI